MASRVDSATAVGTAIAAAARPPRVWLQMSTATIYAHSHDRANDEATGVIGGTEDGVPAYWAFSVDIARQWERALSEAQAPDTRRVALRTSIVMAPRPGRSVRPAVADDQMGPRRTGRRWPAVHVLDPRPRLRPGGRVPAGP
ncbi:hypothetical protein GCM10018952_30040 [Streptosporangium vulgare]